METIKICPQTIYCFQADQPLVEEVLNQTKNIDYKDNVRNLISSKFFYNEKLLNWFDACLEELRGKVYPEIEKLVITGCWANKTNKTQQHHIHGHYNSFISGIFYLTEHESGKTNFMTEDLWYKFDRNLIRYTSHEAVMVSEKIKPKAGQLILFPSHLLHNTDVLNFKEKQVRYSISFNTFIAGRLERNNITSCISLDVKDYRDLLDKKEYEKEIY